MIDKSDNTLKTAETMEALRSLVSDEDQGPTFEVNEVVIMKGYRFRVTRLTEEYGGAITLVPHGPIESGEDIREAKELKREAKQLRKLQRQLRGERR